MKKSFALITALALSISLIAGNAPDKKKAESKQHTVVFCSDVECKNCEKKITENISFEKGVKDLSVNLKDKTVTVTYDAAKCDTTSLAKAIRKLGFTAKVKEYK